MAFPPGIDPAEEERRRRAQEAGDGGGALDGLDGLSEAADAASGCLPDVGGCIPDGCAGCSIDLIAITAIAGLGIMLLR